MCFPKCTNCAADPTPLLDDEGGMIEQENTLNIPDGIHEHVDSVYLNFDFEDGILAFVYETKDSVIIVWTSPEAEEFGQLCAALEIKIL